MTMSNKKRTSYPQAQKESIMRRMCAPENKSVSFLSEESGIPITTLSNWKTKVNNSRQSQTIGRSNYSSRGKFLVVMETYSLPEIKLAEYCRTKGLYVEEVRRWQQSCMNANGNEQEFAKELRNELAVEKKKSHILEKDLNRKDKALAETAALLVLRKKLGAILGEYEEE